MTALNITTNDLTDTAAEARKRTDAYHAELERTMDQVMGAGVDAEVVEQDSVSFATLLEAVLSRGEDIPDWAHEQEPANDNEPQQLDLFHTATSTTTTR